MVGVVEVGEVEVRRTVGVKTSTETWLSERVNRSTSWISGFRD